MTIIYHSRDLDGYTSGAICKLKYPDAKLIGYDYGQPIPWDQLPEGEPVIMVDVSVPYQDMLLFSEHTNNQFTWIDHHISAINDYKTNLEKQGKYLFTVKQNKDDISIYAKDDLCKTGITAVLKNGIAACEIAWQFLFPNQIMPNAIKLLGEYDTWRNQDKWKWENEILPFQFGMREICNSPETFPTMDLFYDNTSDQNRSNVSIIIESGKTILRYQTQVNATQCKKAAFEYTWNGLRCICLNGGGFNSDVFKSVYDPDKHDVMMPFQYSAGGFWTFSLYTTHDNIDCSKIAKEMGGGGHAKAAGFQISSLLGLREVFENLVI